MVLENDLMGKTITLRSVNVCDADFILKLRNDPQISRYLPKLDITIEQQKQWIKIQRSCPNDYYFVINDRYSNKPLGTISIYNIDNEEAETGRFACRGDPEQSVESSLVLLDFAFDVLSLKTLNIWVFKENKAVLHYNKKLGFEFTEGISDTGIHCMNGRLTQHGYKQTCRKIKSYFDKI